MGAGRYVVLAGNTALGAVAASPPVFASEETPRGKPRGALAFKLDLKVQLPASRRPSLHLPAAWAGAIVNLAHSKVLGAVAGKPTPIIGPGRPRAGPPPAGLLLCEGR
jgi:hypothetical protein